MINFQPASRGPEFDASKMLKNKKLTRLEQCCAEKKQKMTNTMCNIFQLMRLNGNRSKSLSSKDWKGVYPSVLANSSTN